jgi:hypothetical protein
MHDEAAFSPRLYYGFYLAYFTHESADEEYELHPFHFRLGKFVTTYPFGLL